MSKIFATDYSKVARVEDDPAWKKNGAHSGNPQALQLIHDPKLDKMVAQFMVQGHGKDVVFGTTNADRAEVMSEKVFTAGQQIVIATRLNLHRYRSNGGQWHVMPVDCHNSNPGPTQSHIMDYVENNTSQGTRLWGGALASNGNTGTIRRDDLKGVQWPGGNDDIWVDFVERILFHPDQTKGLYTRWLNGLVVWDVKAATLVAGSGAYIKTGFYRPAQDLLSIYLEDDMGVFTEIQEGFDFLEIQTPGPGPVPIPIPIPAGTFTARSSIQSGNTLTAGTHFWTIDWQAGPLIAKAVFFVDGKELKTVTPQQPVKQVAAVLDLKGAEKTVGFTVTATDGQVRSFPAFPITVTQAPSPGPDLVQAKIQAQVALDELHASASYKQYKANGTLPGTHLGKTDIALVATLAALNQ